MYPINDRQYLKICAEIAKLMSIRETLDGEDNFLTED